MKMQLKLYFPLRFSVVDRILKKSSLFPLLGAEALHSFLECGWNLETACSGASYIAKEALGTPGYSAEALKAGSFL